MLTKKMTVKFENYPTFELERVPGMKAKFVIDRAKALFPEHRSELLLFAGNRQIPADARIDLEDDISVTGSFEAG